MDMDMKLQWQSLSDGIGVLGRHCQDSVADLDAKMIKHIAGTVGDINSAMLAVNVALRGAMKATQDKLSEFQGDAKELMNRPEKAVKQLQEKVTEVEKALEDLKQKEQRDSQRPPPLQPEWYDMSSPARTHVDPGSTGAGTAPSGDGKPVAAPGPQVSPGQCGGQGGQGWQAGKGAGAPSWTTTDGWQSGKGAGATWWTETDPWSRQGSWQNGGEHVGRAQFYGATAGGPQDPTNPGGTAYPWPAPAGTYAHLRLDSTIFETKFGQSKDNQFDGQKG